MRRSNDYTPPTGDEDIEALASIAGEAFGISPERARRWLGPYAAHARLIRRPVQGQQRIAGGLLLIPMGQFFGGRSLPMTGVAGVGIAPWARGQGTATALMHAALRELHHSGAALSTLYPATYPLYRRAGYELAGGHYRIRIPARGLAIPDPDRSLPVRPVEPDDMRAIERLYRDHATTRQGWLDRGDYIWNRVRRGRNELDVHGFVVGERKIEGYVFYSLKHVEPMGYDLVITDMASTTVRGARRILTLLADARSQARDVIWHGGVDDTFVYLLPERGYEITLAEPWMLRIVDLQRALSGRGYPAHVSTRLELDVTDTVLTANRGRFVLDVADGAAEARPGGRGALRLDIRALAALYAGHATAHQLAAAGVLEGPDKALARAASVFAAPAPSLPDFF